MTNVKVINAELKSDPRSFVLDLKSIWLLSYLYFSEQETVKYHILLKESGVIFVPAIETTPNSDGASWSICAAISSIQVYIMVGT